MKCLDATFQGYQKLKEFLLFALSGFTAIDLSGVLGETKQEQVKKRLICSG